MEKKKIGVFQVCAIIVTIMIVFAVGLTTAVVKKGITVKGNFGAVQTTEQNTEEITDAPTEIETIVEQVTNEKGEVVTDVGGDAVTEVVTKKPETTTGGSTSSGVDLSSNQKILDYYAKAINAASDSGKGLKAGFKMERSATVLQEPDWSNLGALGDLKIDGKTVPEALNKFMGIGKPDSRDYDKGFADNKDGVKRYIPLEDSKLTAGDIKSASFKQSGSDYILTIKVKDGESYCKNQKDAGTNNSPIEKCGMCQGTGDFSEIHNKNAKNVVTAGSGFVSNVTQKTTNCVVEATVDGATGRIKKLVVKFDSSFTIKVTMVGEKSSATATTVTYSNFKY